MTGKRILRLLTMPRFVAFDSGVVAGLLGIGAYLAIVNRHWFIATLMASAALLWMLAIPVRWRLRKLARRVSR